MEREEKKQIQNPEQSLVANQQIILNANGPLGNDT